MDNNIVGQRYVAAGATSIVWVVSYEVEKGMIVPHVRLLKSDDPHTAKLIAVNALSTSWLGLFCVVLVPSLM